MKKHSLELKKRRLERKIKRVLFSFVFPIIFIFSIFVYIFNSNLLSIKTINIRFEGDFNKNIKDGIKYSVKEKLDGKYFGVFSKSNYFFYPKLEILDYIYLKYPEINKVEVDSTDWGLNFYIKAEPETKNMYCKTEPSECYYISDGGKIFSKHNNLKGLNNEIVIFYNFYDRLEPGNNYFDNYEEKEKVASLIKFLERSGIGVSKFIKKTPYIYQVILSNKTNLIIPNDFKKEDFYTIFNKIIKNNDLRGLILKKNNIAYIDLSIKKRVFYCLRGEICEDNF